MHALGDGLGRVVVEALAESAWGVFTLGASIPIALAMGLYIYRVRGGSTRGLTMQMPATSRKIVPIFM